MNDRPSIHDVYMSMAMIFSQYSHDKQTQHGCIITDSEHRIISAGCNGFPHGMNDRILPSTRPENEQERNDPYKNKYFWMLHAERNSLANSASRPPVGSIAYVTGQCCNDCIMALWQSGIKTVYMLNRHGSHLIDETQKKIFNIFVEQTGINIIRINPNWDFAVKILQNN